MSRIGLFSPQDDKQEEQEKDKAIYKPKDKTNQPCHKTKNRSHLSKHDGEIGYSKFLPSRLVKNFHMNAPFFLWMTLRFLFIIHIE